MNCIIIFFRIFFTYIIRLKKHYKIKNYSIRKLKNKLNWEDFFEMGLQIYTHYLWNKEVRIKKKFNLYIIKRVNMLLTLEALKILVTKCHFVILYSIDLIKI